PSGASAAAAKIAGSKIGVRPRIRNDRLREIGIDCLASARVSVPAGVTDDWLASRDRPEDRSRAEPEAFGARTARSSTSEASIADLLSERDPVCSSDRGYGEAPVP